MLILSIYVFSVLKFPSWCMSFGVYSYFRSRSRRQINAEYTVAFSKIKTKVRKYINSIFSSINRDHNEFRTIYMQLVKYLTYCLRGQHSLLYVFPSYPQYTYCLRGQHSLLYVFPSYPQCTYCLRGQHSLLYVFPSYAQTFPLRLLQGTFW